MTGWPQTRRHTALSFVPTTHLLELISTCWNFSLGWVVLRFVLLTQFLADDDFYYQVAMLIL